MFTFMQFLGLKTNQPHFLSRIMLRQSLCLLIESTMLKKCILIEQIYVNRLLCDPY